MKKKIKAFILIVSFMLCGIFMNNNVLEVNAVEEALDRDFNAPVLINIGERIMRSPKYAGHRLGFYMNVQDDSGLSDITLVLKSGEEYLYASASLIDEEEEGRYYCSFYTDQYAKTGRYQIHKLILVDDSAHKNTSSYLYDSNFDELVNEEDGKTVTVYLDLDIEQSRDWIITDTSSRMFEDDWKSLEENGTIVIKGAKLPANFLTYAKGKNATIVISDKLGVAEIEFKAESLSANALENGMELSIEREAIEKKQLGSTKEEAYHLVNLSGKNANIPMTMRIRIGDELYEKSFSSQLNASLIERDENNYIIKVTMIAENLKKYPLFDDDSTNVDVKLEHGINQSQVTYAISVTEHKHDYKLNRILSKASFASDGSILLKCKNCPYHSMETVKKVDSVKLYYTTTTYNGNIRRPAVTVKDIDGNRLIKDTDYTVTYQAGRKDPGRYLVKVILKGKYEGSTARLFTITPAMPKNFKVKLYGYDDIKLSWSSSKGADGYYIYEVDSKGKHTYLGRTTKTTYSISNKKDGTKYTYAVAPYFWNKSNETRYFGEKTKNVSITTLKKVAGLKVKNNTSKDVAISWTKVTNATGYQVSCSTSKTGTKIIYTTTGTTKIYKPTTSKTLYYKVRAYKTVDGKRIYAPWTSVVAHRRK